MRYISRDGYTPGTAWLEKATELTEELYGASTDDERKDIIKRNSKHWRKLKSQLLDLSNGKCWFSEARDIYSYPEVEHFRPKGLIAKNLDKSEREGYWWIAFDYKNYRICGNVGNRKKGSFFPLKAGSVKATAESPHIDDEIYYLLDPCNEDDPDLLSFDMSGKARPSSHCGPWDNERVTVTIERLQLDYERLQEARRDVWSTCHRLLNECDNLAISFHDNASATIREKIRNIRKELRERISIEAELSRVAIACLENSDTTTASKILSQV